ncbi:HAD-superfamily hydrolase, subfamily IA, variant 1 [Ferroglobus placidus DSM 10642]|uniref:HAD-superfamily hydrolase, subfamily IA, variant 1 n=2 Tax=Ferroglobus placidus TaxID=54261 RepID=D3S146_FERPA|nr:HAD-superfamily hydrolase, subfamily IA, variant 1 [Ferroglobus placidus DSM 10642]
MTFKALIFDFEGTLVNFAWDLSKAVKEAKSVLEERGIEIESSNYAEIYNFVASYHPSLISLIDNIYDKYDLEAFKRWKLREGVKEVLEKLRVKKAVVSNVSKDVLKKALEKFQIAGSFEVVIGRKDVQLLKPSPMGILKAIESLKVSKKDVLFVGDSRSDVEACKRAGIKIAVLEGENKFSELDADYKLNSFSDILSLPIQGL